MTELISYMKGLYDENLAKKLNNPLLQAKTYWSILLSDNVKKDILLYRDLRLDGNKNKFILEATLSQVTLIDS